MRGEAVRRSSHAPTMPPAPSLHAREFVWLPPAVTNGTLTAGFIGHTARAGLEDTASDAIAIAKTPAVRDARSIMTHLRKERRAPVGGCRVGARPKDAETTGRLAASRLPL